MRPSCGLEGSAKSRFGIRPASRASRPPSTAARIAWRELRASRAKFVFVLLSVAIGVAALTGVPGKSIVVAEDGEELATLTAHLARVEEHATALGPEMVTWPLVSRLYHFCSSGLFSLWCAPGLAISMPTERELEVVACQARSLQSSVW